MTRRRAVLTMTAASLLAAATGSAARDGAPAAGDPVAAELQRWSTFLRTYTSSDEIWPQVKGASETVLQRAQQALADGRPLLALLRLAYVQENLEAVAYMGERSPQQRKEKAAFETEWARMGRVIPGALAPPARSVMDGVRPAAVRAMGEAAAAQVRVYYEASLEYGQSTTPDSGLFYLGAAQARSRFVEFARRLAQKGGPPAPPVRSLVVELDALEGELLAAYRPPLSIDRHPDFINASATLKEARELDQAGLHHGALLRYLQAAQRLAQIRGAALDEAGAAAALRELEARLGSDTVDHSLGRLFLETAQAELARPPAEGKPAVAIAIAADVLPRYFGALRPSPPAAAATAPRATVTLVRWPYT
jgi:hypothetical protein